MIWMNSTVKVLDTENVPKRGFSMGLSFRLELGFNQRTVRHSLSEIASTRPSYKPPNDPVHPSGRWEALAPLRAILGSPEEKGW